MQVIKVACRKGEMTLQGGIIRPLLPMIQHYPSIERNKYRPCRDSYSGEIQQMP